MLRIAVIGDLARNRALVASQALKTGIEFETGLKPSTSLSKLDLILLREDDADAESELAALVEAQPILSSIAARWTDEPDEGAFDQAIQNSLLDTYGFIVGYSDQMHKVCKWIRAIAHQATAALDLRTLIIGETGTGKELVAKAIHKVGSRANSPFVALNCAGFSKGLIDSALFGHKKGAFTDAIADHEGALKRADSGVLFLDEIGDLPLELQTKFLRVLEEKTFVPLGSKVSHKLLAQVVSATNRKIDQDVKTGRFRADLYFRIAHLTIALPPLRERINDIPVLVHQFLGEHGFRADFIDRELLFKMLDYDWPGNVRELRKMVEQLILLAGASSYVGKEEWPLLISSPQTKEPMSVPQPPDLLVSSPSAREEKRSAKLADRRDDFDRAVLEEVLTRHGFDTRLAAEELGISRKSVYNLAHRLGISLRQIVDD